MNQSLLESVSRLLLAIAIAVLAAVLAFGGQRDAIAQTRTAQCETLNGTKKDAVETMNSMLGAGRTEFIVTAGGLFCGW